MAVYQALYRKYRPQTFDDMVGQSAVTQTLKTQLNKDQLSHAYLFTGSRGTGKTSCAKILAKAVNCLQPIDGNPCNCCEACKAIDSGSCMDVLEIDAASNNGVDNVRDLRDDAIYSPSQVKKRVYIIDEVHMLSISAFNALLKIIEEPPEHLLFILATTELHKVPATILSRCQRFAFRRISQEDIASRLQYVAYQENIDLDDSAARVIARMADGGMRDGLKFKAWQPGGAGTDFLTEAHLDLPMEFESIGKAGSRLGTALAMAVDHEINMVSLVRNLEEFFARESCGWCTPCRDGLPWSVKILRALERGEGQPGDIETLEQLCRFLGPGKTFCAHAPGAVEPLQSAIKYFREEFEAGIKQPFSNTHLINGIQPNLLKERW